jgi:hypothetical protein
VPIATAAGPLILYLAAVADLGAGFSAATLRDALREAAYASGCADPVVSMEIVRGPRPALKVEVECTRRRQRSAPDDANQFYPGEGHRQ